MVINVQSESCVYLTLEFMNREFHETEDVTNSVVGEVLVYWLSCLGLNEIFHCR